ncbi:MAG: MerR family transcriptional regulator [Alphaproteobacteria bacterium]|nr:MerR family transcriptional regulator [Alphaproteobacteria bacterium]
MENKEYFSSINDVSKRLGVPAHTLRYWEKQFPTAIKPTTGAGGRRYYRSETVDKLFVIKDLLYTHGMTIAGVKKMLREGNLPSQSDQISTENIQISAQPSVVADMSPNINNDDIDMAISFLDAARSLLQ